MGDSPTEIELVRRAVARDEDALTQLLVLHYGSLEREISRWIPRSLRTTLDAADVLQKTFVKIWSHIGSFEIREAGSFYGWMVRIAKNVLLDEQKAAARKKRNRRRVEQPEGSDSMIPLLELVAQDAKTPSVVVATREAVAALRLALAGLPEEQRTVLELRYVLGLPEKDVARRLGRTEGAVRMACARAREHLRKSMGRASKYFSGGA